MLKTIEGILEPTGQVNFSEQFKVSKSMKVLVTILPEERKTKTEETVARKKISPSWIGKYSSNGKLDDSRESIY